MLQMMIFVVPMTSLDVADVFFECCKLLGCTMLHASNNSLDVFFCELSLDVVDIVLDEL
jgi:hypothetical protein